MSDIDPVAYGRLLETVSNLSERVGSMEEKVTSMHEMMLKARGGWKTLLAVGTLAGATAAFFVKIAAYFAVKPPTT
jgi:hypothetical protein